MTQQSLTATDIIAAASECLLDAGYRELTSTSPPTELSVERFFEDPYGVVEVVVFETWAELVEQWPEAQASLVELISKYVGLQQPKAWDGYLVLLTPGLLPSEAYEIAARIRYDTSRVRKLLATGDELRNTSDVTRTLFPLLPLAPELHTTLQQDRAFDLLPPILEKYGVKREASRTLLEAFVNHRQLMESLFEFLSGTE